MCFFKNFFVIICIILFRFQCLFIPSAPFKQRTTETVWNCYKNKPDCDIGNVVTLLFLLSNCNIVFSINILQLINNETSLKTLISKPGHKKSYGYLFLFKHIDPGIIHYDLSFQLFTGILMTTFLNDFGYSRWHFVLCPSLGNMI